MLPDLLIDNEALRFYTRVSTNSLSLGALRTAVTSQITDRPRASAQALRCQSFLQEGRTCWGFELTCGQQGTDRN
jgi:hypothetical protein